MLKKLWLVYYILYIYTYTYTYTYTTYIYIWWDKTVKSAFFFLNLYYTCHRSWVISLVINWLDESGNISLDWVWQALF